MGPVMNFALALVIFFAIVLAYGIAGTTVDFIDENATEYAAGLRPGDKITKIEDTRVRYWEDLTNEIIKHENGYTMTVVRNNVEQSFVMQQNYRYIVGISPTEANGEYTTELAVVNVNFPGEKAGLKSGDKVLSINGVTTLTWEEIRSNIANSGGVNLFFEIERDNQIQIIEVIPENQITIGFYTEMDKSILTAITGSIHRVVFYITLMFQLIGMMISGQVGSEAVAGPIGIISMVGEAARLGLYPLLNLMAFININLGFINLMPVPALDGSRLVFIAIEGIRGKRISPEKEGYIHFIGFVLLMALMFFVLYKDIIKLLN
jgi:regulator of sigma E protease